MTLLTARDLVKHFGSFTALDGVDLDLARGERLVICGPSGSGKSTLIRCINRLEQPDSGTITIEGLPATDLQGLRRRVGMVFQQFNLFPNLTARENVAVAPRKLLGLSRAEADARLRDRGLAAMAADLDAATARRIDLRTPARVQRAWEVLQATGRGLADWQTDTGPPLLAPDRVSALVLEPDRTWLAARIDQRFDAMMAAGALDEVRAALPAWQPGAPWTRAIGAQELAAHLRGECLLAEAVAAAKIASRQYAKRQRTWFRSRMAHWTRIALP